MSKSKHTEAQMIGALKQLEAGRKAEDVAREVGVSKHTIYAWKAKYGGMTVSEAGVNPARAEPEMKRRDARPLLLPIVALALLTALGLAKRADAEPVWWWSAACGGPVMTLEVVLDHAVIYRATVPLCQADRDSPASQGEKQAEVEFAFRPQRAITWSDYRDTDNVTKANVELEGNIWQAGADPDDLLIGVSFATGFDIYMNTVHIALPWQMSQDSIEKGLELITFPDESQMEKGLPSANASGAKTNEWVPTFRDFPGPGIFAGKPAPLVPEVSFGPEGNRKIAEQDGKPPNFAGRYGIAEFGCGASCVNIALIDLAAC